MKSSFTRQEAEQMSAQIHHELEALKTLAVAIQNKIGRDSPARNIAITQAVGTMLLAFDGVMVALYGWCEVDGVKDSPAKAFVAAASNELFQRHQLDTFLSSSLVRIHRMMEVQQHDHVEYVQDKREKK